MKPLTRAEIMKAIPEIKPGSFWYLIFQARVKSRPGEVRNGRYYRLFESGAVGKIKKHLEGGR